MQVLIPLLAFFTTACCQISMKFDPSPPPIGQRPKWMVLKEPIETTARWKVLQAWQVMWNSQQHKIAVKNARKS